MGLDEAALGELLLAQVRQGMQIIGLKASDDLIHLLALALQPFLGIQMFECLADLDIRTIELQQPFVGRDRLTDVPFLHETLGAITQHPSTHDAGRVGSPLRHWR